MRYKIENENAKAELEYNNRIYPIDDTLAGYKKFSDVMQKADAGPEDILTAGLGEEAAKEIMNTNPRYKDIQEADSYGIIIKIPQGFKSEIIIFFITT